MVESGAWMADLGVGGGGWWVVVVVESGGFRIPFVQGLGSGETFS